VSADYEPGREAAMQEVLAGYQRGLTKLDPGDHEERTWFTERLRDLWTCTGSWPIQAVPALDEDTGTRVGTIDARRPRGAPLPDGDRP
jgi:hypothetical protein